MSLLDHPEARALLADADLIPEAVRTCEGRLTAFIGRHLPHLYPVEQRANAALVISGLLGGLRRKTCEPIAVEAGVHRKPIQFLVVAGKWDDEAVMAELRRHVAEELGDERAVLVVDATTFPESGADSCGVGRQWSGRLGKQENCQRGISLACAAPGGYAPLDRRLYPPQGLGRRPRPAGQVPRPRGGRVPRGLADRRRADRAVRTRRAERHRRPRPGESAPEPPPRWRPCPGGPPPARRRLGGWAAGGPVGAAGGPGRRAGLLRVDAMAVRVRTRLEHRVGPEERLVVMRTVEAEPEVHFALSNAAADVPLKALVRAQFARHRIEEVFETAMQEAGLGHYGVRSWVGRHHHVTLSLLALWFLCGERRRLGGETAAATVSRVREVFARLLRVPAPSAKRIADVSRVQQRKELARIYKWHKATGASRPAGRILTPADQ